MKRLIVNADDFGLTSGVNLGILRAHREGIVTSATIMVNMPAAAEAFDLARVTPTLGVGLHITLTGGRPLSPHVPSLTDAGGRFLKLPELSARARPEDLEQEIRAQAQAFLDVGLVPDHLDSHHHVHLQVPAVREIVARVAGELGVPMRGAKGGPAFLDSFYGLERVTVERLAQTLGGLAEGSTTEIMCHPGLLDPELLHGSRYAVERVHELATLIDPAIREVVAAAGIALLNYTTH